MYPLTTDTFCTGAYFFDRRSRSFRRIRTHPFPLCDENLFFAYGRSRIRSRLRWSSSTANCLMATDSALSRSGASTEPRYSPLLRVMMTRQLRGGFLGLVRLDTAAT